jgi:predicted nucleotidyltransferase
MMNVDRSFYIRELSRELGIPYSMLYKEVRNLVSLGVVNEEKRGKVTLISVNRSVPFFTELKGLMVKTVGLRDLIRMAFLGLKGLRYVLIYGSFAGGDESLSSDVDLLVVGDVDEEMVLSLVGRMEKEVGREINYILWSEEEFMRRVESRHHLLREIASKPVIMLVGDEDEFRRAVAK